MILIYMNSYLFLIFFFQGSNFLFRYLLTDKIPYLSVCGIIIALIHMILPMDKINDFIFKTSLDNLKS
jgi:hypothetical protein